jgi:DNA modification methylase
MIQQALLCRKPTAGSTHNFYHYPARFSPAIPRAVIEAFSEPGDLVLDPFMGGGTTIIEALSLGREALGVDLNALAHFVAEVRTTPLSSWDEIALERWAVSASKDLPRHDEARREPRSGATNLPRAVELFVTHALKDVERLNLERRRAFARCALLRLGQWALDCRDFVSPRRKLLADHLPGLIREMLDGMGEFVEACSSAGFRKNEITGSRTLMHGSCVELPTLLQRVGYDKKADLVVTSPPYPGVHVLYHRWQYRGRKETSAPYWIANVPDGFGGAYYTAGSRTPTGMRNYFDTIRTAFSAVRQVVSPRAVVVQLVGFADVTTQLPLYMDCMRQAGFREWTPDANSDRLCRTVPNRKWYARLKGELDAASEIMLIHQVAETLNAPKVPSA